MPKPKKHVDSAARQHAYRVRKSRTTADLYETARYWEGACREAEPVLLRAARLCTRYGLPAATLYDLTASLDRLDRLDQ